MLSFKEIQDKFTAQIDTAGTVSTVLRDRHKYLLDTTSECKQTALNLWVNDIINVNEYDILDEIIDKAFTKALDRYYK